MSDQTPEQPTPTIPPPVRTWAYAIGVVAGAFAIAAPDPWQPYLIALSTAANALAFGYRPTR